ncbi:YncE family protein, partial [Sphaerimonospora thailandensis]|uniref:YncE family protein n=1 Tax=Sphaerimonospora thailandensis TaxID=795644 RepID=UPI00389994D6
TTTIPGVPSPTGVAITPDGNRAYVTNFFTGNVSVINTATNTVTTTVPVGAGPAGVAITPGGNRAYVTNFGSNNVSVINTATNTVTTTVPVGNRPLGVAVARIRTTPPQPPISRRPTKIKATVDNIM